MKLLRLIFLLLPIASAIEINCDYKKFSYEYVNEIYICSPKNDLSITSRKTAWISKIYGEHGFSKSARDVQGFFSNSGYHRVQYMPQGFQDKFSNIILVIINKGRIKDLEKEDLKQFPKLVYLDLSENDITIIEEHLFIYNPNLKIIKLNNNKIYQIYPKEFENLNFLVNLQIVGNQCVNGFAYNKDILKSFIHEVGIKCFPINKFVIEQFEQYEKSKSRTELHLIFIIIYGIFFSLLIPAIMFIFYELYNKKSKVNEDADIKEEKEFNEIKPKNIEATAPRESNIYNDFFHASCSKNI